MKRGLALFMGGAAVAVVAVHVAALAAKFAWVGIHLMREEAGR